MQLTNIKQVYNQKIAHVNTKLSYVFWLLSLSIFKKYQYQKIYSLLLYSFVIYRE
jgi:hypothetical protein